MPDEVSRAEPELLCRLDETTRALADLAAVLEREEDLGRVLQRSVDQLTSAVPGADMASVSVLRDGDGAETVASSSDRVWAIDSDQYAAGEGPCLAVVCWNRESCRSRPRRSVAEEEHLRRSKGGGAVSALRSQQTTASVV